MTPDEYITILFRKYLDGTYTSKELDTLLQYFDMEEASDQLTSLIEQALAKPASDAIDHEQVKAIKDRVAAKLPLDKPARRLTHWLPYAAAVLIAATAATWIFFGDQIVNRKSTIVNVDDIAPGGNRATLTLADGRTIDLSEAQTGIIVGDEVVYNDGSEVLERGQDSPSGTEKGELTTNYYVLNTPKGGTYQLTLPDGSNIWLNACSSLKYPSRFSENERVVELIGEGYFSVEKDERKPFRIKSAGQTVEVLGTEFNISAYGDEPETKTTLVEGVVEIVNLKSKILNRLSPGEQSIVHKGNIKINEVDVQQYVSWKSGDIVLTGVPLPTLMRQIARWYDIEVRIEKDPGSVEFFGTVSRQRKLSAVLEAMEATGTVQFRMDGNTLIVNPK
ncbi:FecR family protein [Parapedobacter tibetensis]|uniref:FecR family protein n=1 Tax=Parapedobacter tibetensis TaxID=2972951 RepID=UPI00214DD653|nr:FecR family protein [Parapedobacter tibetensis]